MRDENAPSRDVLWKMYQEHCTQGRHHETQRSAVIQRSHGRLSGHYRYCDL
jgi:hypothetical protein